MVTMWWEILSMLELIALGYCNSMFLDEDLVYFCGHGEDSGSAILAQFPAVL